MNINDKNLQETKKLNQQAKQGSFSNLQSSTDFNSPDTQEARELNSQYSKGSSSFSNVSSSSGFISSNNSVLEETKKLNRQSKQSK